MYPITVVRTNSPLHDGIVRFIVDRSTVLGNPYRINPAWDQNGAGRKRVIDLYRKWLWQKSQARDSSVLAELKRIKAAALVGPVELGCHCAPRPCHADVIARCIIWACKSR